MQWKIGKKSEQAKIRAQISKMMPPIISPQKKTADGLLQYDSNLMKIKSLQDNFLKNEKVFKKSYRINNKVLYSTRNYIISCDIP